MLDATIDSILRALRDRKITSREVVQWHMDRIAAYDRSGPCLTAVETLNPAALDEADRLDALLRRSGPAGPLHGIPTMLKDQVETADMPTTFGSALFKHYRSGRDATVVARLRAAGAIILAKNTMSEFAQPGYHGSAFGYTRNAYDTRRAPGGSSCGTGAAVGARFGVVGIGEDTGGSIRNPASHNALVGLRPTVGLVSRFVMLPGTPSRDTLGPMTRTVRDAAVLLDVIAGYDPNDSTTAYSVGRVPPSYTALLDDVPAEVRIGVVRERLSANSDPSADDYGQVRSAFDRAIGAMIEAGMKIVDPVAMGRVVELLQQASGVGESEAAVDRYLTEIPDAPVRSLREIVLAPDGLVMPSQRALLADAIGHTTNSPAYLAALVNRRELRREVLKVMADAGVDALMFPTADHFPPLVPDDILTSAESRRGRGSNNGLSSATAFPSLTVPMGLAGGIPLGLSILGRPFSEGLLLRIAHAYEGLRGPIPPPASAPDLATPARE